MSKAREQRPHRQSEAEMRPRMQIAKRAGACACEEGWGAGGLASLWIQLNMTEGHSRSPQILPDHSMYDKK